MNKVYLILLLLFVSVFANGMDQQKTTSALDELRPAANSKLIRQGDFEVGGDFQFGYSSATGFDVTVNPKAQYFVVDRFSMGGVIKFGTTDRIRTVGFGPSVSLYFIDMGKWAAYFGQNFTSTTVSTSGYSVEFFEGTSTLGLNYFLVPNVAMGLSLNGNYLISGEIEKEDTIAMRGNFQIYF